MYNYFARTPMLDVAPHAPNIPFIKCKSEHGADEYNTRAYIRTYIYETLFRQHESTAPPPFTNTVTVTAAAATPVLNFRHVALLGASTIWRCSTLSESPNARTQFTWEART